MLTPDSKVRCNFAKDDSAFFFSFFLFLATLHFGHAQKKEHHAFNFGRSVSRFADTKQSLWIRLIDVTIVPQNVSRDRLM